MRKPFLKDKHFYIIAGLFIVCTIFYYFGELVNLFGWDALRREIFYTVHDPHRMLFLVPILYSGYYFRLRGAILANILALIIMLPGAFIISDFPDAILRIPLFILVALAVSILTAIIFNERDRVRRSFNALKRSEEKYRSILDQLYDSYYEVDLDGNFTLANNSVCQSLGYTREELIEKNYRLMVPEDAKRSLLLAFNEVYRTSEPNKGFEHKVICKDGSTLSVESSISLRKNELGEIVGFRSVSRDITERKQGEQALRDSEERYRSLVENINDVFYTMDNEGNITYVSPVVEKLSKYKVSDLIGQSFISLIHPDDLPGLTDSFNRLVSGQLEPWEFRIFDKDGTIIYVRTSSRPIYKDGEVVGLTALITDITERKQMELKLEQMATHDFLTGLPNRVLLTDRFTMAAALACRNKTRLAVMSLDLDKFKSINDTLGHAAGDQVLKTISSRLRGIIRSSDTAARVGGDEFVLIMMETNHREDATAIAQRILDSFREPLLIDGHNIIVSTSIGVANYPEDAQDLDTLIKKSDAAMYYSKGHGRNQFKFFSDGDVHLGGDHKSGTDRQNQP
ncbi:MAG: PAS domain S-box protein [Dehalococcoidia bacterium]|nr:PAS domain S-box protein [Dehalococcoidia bacterium]